jgi:hypothetical protein
MADKLRDMSGGSNHDGGIVSPGAIVVSVAALARKPGAPKSKWVFSISSALSSDNKKRLEIFVAADV